MPNDEREDDAGEDHATIECFCDRCGQVFLWRLDDPDSMRCPNCPDTDD
jgi:exosome complex RNA-binding protein Csl4